MSKPTEWRDVVGLEGLYQVSTSGLVRGVDRRVAHGHSRSVFVSGRILKPTIINDGYQLMRMSKDDKQTSRLVHRLVLEAFVGPCPDGMEGCHNDGDPGNNDLSNLRWDTRSNNNFDAIKHGTHVQARKTHCPQRHPYDAENAARYRDKQGVVRRRCRVCARKRASEYARRRRAQKAAAA